MIELAVSEGLTAGQAPIHEEGQKSQKGTAKFESSHVHYYARYFGDPISRIFWEEGRMRLGILPGHGSDFAELISRKALSDLFLDGSLVEPIPIAQSLGFEAVFDLPFAIPVTFWHEWSPMMLRAAAARFLGLIRRLVERRLVLRNPHPWNLLYDGQRFTYINPGSVVPLDGETFARSYEKIARFFLRPLLLIEHGFGHMAYRLMGDARDGVVAQDVSFLDAEWLKWEKGRSVGCAAAFLGEIELRLSAFQRNLVVGHWLNYFSQDCNFSPGTSWSRKQEVLERLLADPAIRTVLDLGANSGYYARLSARYGREVIATDFDPALVDRVFEEGSPGPGRIYPVILDFAHPAGGQGVRGEWLPSAAERLNADLVLFFALSHHMVFGRYRLDFEQVAQGIRSFSRNWALVEYIERGIIDPSDCRPEADEWYRIEYLEAALKRHFPAVQSLPPASDGRRIIVCGPEWSGL